MTKNCHDCVHYRVPASVARLCRDEVTGRDAEVVKALDDAARQEHATVEEERVMLTHEGLFEGVWHTRPRGTPYCAVHASQNFYYSPERKNPDLDCPDHEAAGRIPGDCSTCRHLQIPDGYVRDRRNLRKLADAAIAAPQFGEAASERQRLIGTIAARKAHEVSELYRNAGWMPTEPRYVRWCRALSEAGQYWMAEAINTQSACTAYSPGVETREEVPPETEAGSSTESGSIDELLHKGIALLRTGASQHSSFTGHVLARGTPPLTSEMARRARVAAEILCGRALSRTEDMQHREYLMQAWRMTSRDAIAVHLVFIREYPVLAAGKLSAQDRTTLLERIHRQSRLSQPDFAHWLCRVSE